MSEPTQTELAFTPIRLDTAEDLRVLMKAEHAASDEQWAAITAPLRPTVVVAGAGSGKTTLMAQRVVWLVATGKVRPEEVLGLTFTTKAAAELRQRVTAALGAAGLLDRSVVAEGEDVLEPTVATYHAYAANLLTDHGLRIGHEPDTRVVSDASRYQLGARVIERFTGHIELLTDHPATAIQNLLALDGAMSEHLVDEDDVRRTDEEARRGFERAIAEEQAGKARKTYLEPPAKAVNAIDRRAELLQLVRGYRTLKADLGLMDFGDQIALAARLVDDQPEVGELERARFKVVLLDEYQDTSVAQATMLARLFSGPDDDHGLGHPVMAVGDPNQAIYGWRGASVSNILNFADTFPAADGEPGRLPLTVNRRSDRRILEVANRLAAPLLEAYGDKVARLRASAIAGEGLVETHVHERALDELDWLAGAVKEAHGTGKAWSDIGVLSRDNAQAEEVYDTLTSAGIPVEIVGLSGLVRLPEVAEVVATLTLLHDVTANTSMLTLLTGPRWAIGPRDLRLLALRAAEIAGVRGRKEAATVADQLLQIADGIDASELPALSDAVEAPGEASYSSEALDRFALLATELRRLRAHVGDPLLDVVRRIIDTTGVDVELASATSPAAAARRDNLDLFVKAVAEFQSVDGDVTLPALLAYLTAEDDQGNGLDVATPTAADSVKLLTVHRAKGLEWSSVFCVGVGETRFPSNRSRTLWTSSPAVLPAPLRGDRADQPQLAGHDKAALDAYRAATKAHDAEEELRLGYVAYTRAAHHLAVTSYVWGQRATPFGPSDYQRVVRDQLEEWGERVEHWIEKPAPKSPNPNDDVDPSRPWPVPGPGEEAARRIAAADLVRTIDRTAPGRGPRHGRGRPGRRVGRRPRPADQGGSCGAVDVDRPAAAEQPVRHLDGAAARRPRDVRPRARPADASTAGARGALRHRLPRVGRGPVRPAGPHRARRAARPCRRRHRRRGRPRRGGQALRGRSLRRPSPARRRGAVRPRPRRAGGSRPYRRGLRRALRLGRRLPRRRLEDQPQRDRRPAPARPLPPRLVRAHRHAARAGARGVPLRPLRTHGRADRPARPGRSREAAR